MLGSFVGCVVQNKNKIDYSFYLNVVLQTDLDLKNLALISSAGSNHVVSGPVV